MEGYRTSGPTQGRSNRFPSGIILTGGGLTIPQRVAVADAAYTAQVSDFLIAYTSLTAGRTVTLPAAAAVAGRYYIVKDESGSAGGSNITVQSASGNIDGAASKTISSAYGVLRVYSNGTAFFTW
jgi:hypothetical protein